MKTIKIVRDWQDRNQTLGKCTVYDENNKPLFSAISLERGWRNNQSNVSCVPKGRYPVVLEWSPRFQKDLWELKNVPNRAECKFHASNFWYQLNGCIALGLKLKDLNNDGYNDITNSRNTMKAFHLALGKEKRAELVITDSESCNCS
ncbi:DUF5675 family protein [uncultured Winogradskyella sp.]|uniref:DUF5675 family protein n=1 Tax=uncultured Winogradskyella sp. TaxID=395353 RepID=UPI002605F560|nr:DUF5675 family protein [uncultured Winogradskyella sp.]